VPPRHSASLPYATAGDAAADMRSPIVLYACSVADLERHRVCGQQDRSACERLPTRPLSSCTTPRPRRIAEVVLLLANQDPRSATHELQLTPLAENWTP
jgi:hypothetical protein